MALNVHLSLGSDDLIGLVVQTMAWTFKAFARAAKMVSVAQLVQV